MGIKCSIPTHQLRKNCPGCNGLIHVICGRVLHEDEGPFKADETMCPNFDPFVAHKPNGPPAQKRPRSQLPLVCQQPHLQQQKSSGQHNKSRQQVNQLQHQPLQPLPMQQQVLQPQHQPLQPPHTQEQVPQPPLQQRKRKKSAQKHQQVKEENIGSRYNSEENG